MAHERFGKSDRKRKRLGLTFVTGESRNSSIAGVNAAGGVFALVIGGGT